MKYSDAVMIIEKEIEGHKRLKNFYVSCGRANDIIKAENEREIIDALETVLKGNENDET